MIMPVSSTDNPKNLSRRVRVTSAEEALSPTVIYSAEAEKAGVRDPVRMG